MPFPDSQASTSRRPVRPLSTNFVVATAKRTPSERKLGTVVVLDAQGLIAFLVGEPALEAVHDMLRSGEQTLMATINLAETRDHMRRLRGASAEVLDADILTTDIHFTAVDTELAVAAAELRTTHYHRSRRAVSLADCTAAALALDRGIRLATSDPALLALMVDEGGEIQPLPGSDGSLWAPPRVR